MTNHNAAKLDPVQVQQVRALHAMRFTTGSIAAAFDVCTRTVRNIARGRAWWFLPLEPVPLPVLPSDRALRLKLKAPKRMTTTEQERVDAFRRHLAAAIDDAAEREGLATLLLSHWTPRRPNQHRREVVAL